jgi:hypothetical protein
VSGGIGSLHPEFEGELAVERVPDDFIARLEHRVVDGLLIPGRRARANYEVRSSSHDALTFEAADFLTAYAVGLNQVEVRSTGSSVSYRVRFDRWSRYVTLHGLALGVVLAGAYLFPAVRHDVQGYAAGPLLFWGMLLFWSLGWPRIMVALHRPFARQLLERILREVLGASAERLSA